MTANETPNLLDPVKDPNFLSFTCTDGCVDHDQVGNGRGECLGCAVDDASRAYESRLSDGDIAYVVKESRLEAEVDWLFRRIKHLCTVRHGDPFYYFHGHHEMLEPVVPNPSKNKSIKGAKRKRILERDQYRCQGCGTWEDLGIDHIVPQLHDGSNDDDNLQTLCRPCNSSKGTKTQDEWMAWKAAQ